MTAEKTKTKPAQEPRQLREIYYKAVRFREDFDIQIGQNHCSQMGRLEGSTRKKPSRYSARWIVGSPVLFVRWLTSQGAVIEYDIPLTAIMACTRIPLDDEPAELTAIK